MLARHLERSGQNPEEFEDDWAIFEAFPTYVVSIAPDGTWVGAAPADWANKALR